MGPGHAGQPSARCNTSRCVSCALCDRGVSVTIRGAAPVPRAESCGDCETATRELSEARVQRETLTACALSLDLTAD
jgi:hypothetical protein